MTADSARATPLHLRQRCCKYRRRAALAKNVRLAASLQIALPLRGARRAFIYVAPSKLLLEQVRAELDALGADVVTITSDTDAGQVVKALLRHLQRFTEGGQVLLVSHQAYFGLPYFPQHGGWRALIDEVPQLDRFFTLAEPSDVALLISHLEPGRVITPRLAQLRVKTGVDDRTSSITKVFVDALSRIRICTSIWNPGMAR